MIKVSFFKETGSRCKSDRRNYRITQGVKECSSEAIPLWRYLVTANGHSEAICPVFERTLHAISKKIL